MVKKPTGGGRGHNVPPPPRQIGLRDNIKKLYLVEVTCFSSPSVTQNELILNIATKNFLTIQISKIIKIYDAIIPRKFHRSCERLIILV